MSRVHNYQLNLVGFHIDGRLVLLGKYFGRRYNYSMYRIWKLNEGAGVGRNGYEWCQWHLDLPRDIVFCQMWVNSSRCILWNSMEMKLHICNDDGRLMQTISLPRPPNSGRTPRWILKAYESNNVWWP
jgi:hypothetical protein